MDFVDDVNIKNKRVVLRCDFNVSVVDGIIEDDTRLLKSLKTINYLLDRGCSIVLLSHLGRIKCYDDLLKNSLEPISKRLSELLDKEVLFFDKLVSYEVIHKANNLEPGEIMLLENTRFCDYPKSSESKNDMRLAKYFASLGDIFVIDAFASMHRLHSSTAGISNYLDTYYGFLVKEELLNLSYLTNNLEQPYTVFMGASKIDDKIRYVKNILNKCDYLLLGGGVANSFLYVLGEDLGSSIRTCDKDTLKEVKILLNEYQDKIILPTDFVIDNNQVRDIGEKTINKYQEYYKKSKTIFINGTPGQFEENKYAYGTKMLFEILKDIDAVKIAGGGATLNAISKFNCNDYFTYLSSGGGALLEFISTESLSVIEYINDNKRNKVKSKFLKK